MGKKYLDTKQDTIEAAVLDVWVDSAEEQEAIQSAARMIIGEGEKHHRDNPHPAGSSKWHAYNKRMQAAKDKEEGKKTYKQQGLGAEPPKVDTALSDLPAPQAAALGYVPPPVVARSSVGAKAGQLPSIGAQTAAAIAGTDKKTDDKKKEADPFKKHRIGDVAGPTVDIKKLPKIKAEPKKAEKPAEKKPKKKAKKWVDPDTQVQKGHRDYPQNPDKTFGPRHKWSRGKYAGSDDPRFSADPRAGRGDLQYQHYQHELEVQEAIRNAANRMISEMEDPRGGGASGAIRTHKARDAERKKLGTGVYSRPVPRSKIKPPKVPAVPVGKVQAIELPKARLSPGALGGIRPDPKTKPKTKPGRSPGALGGKRPDTSARDYGGGPEIKPKAKPVMTKNQAAVAYGGGPEIKPKTKPVMTKKQAAVAYGGGPEIGLQKKPTKPRTGIKPPSQLEKEKTKTPRTGIKPPSQLEREKPRTARPGIKPPSVLAKKPVKPKIPAGISKMKIAPAAKKTSRYIANVKGSRSSNPLTGRSKEDRDNIEFAGNSYQPEDGDYMQEWHDKKGNEHRVKNRDKRMHEVTGDKEEYTKFFNSALKKFGVTSPSQLKGKKEKEFYDYVDANWKGDDEKAEQVVRDFKVNSMREALRQMWSQQNEEGDVGQRHPGSKPGVWKRSPGAMGGKKKTDTGGKPVVINLKPKTGNPHY